MNNKKYIPIKWFVALLFFIVFLSLIIVLIKSSFNLTKELVVKESYLVKDLAKIMANSLSPYYRELNFSTKNIISGNEIIVHPLDKELILRTSSTLNDPVKEKFVTIGDINVSLGHDEPNLYGLIEVHDEKISIYDYKKDTNFNNSDQVRIKIKNNSDNKHYKFLLLPTSDTKNSNMSVYAVDENWNKEIDVPTNINISAYFVKLRNNNYLIRFKIKDFYPPKNSNKTKTLLFLDYKNIDNFTKGNIISKNTGKFKPNSDESTINIIKSDFQGILDSIKLESGNVEVFLFNSKKQELATKKYENYSPDSNKDSLVKKSFDYFEPYIMKYLLTEDTIEVNENILSDINKSKESPDNIIGYLQIKKNIRSIYFSVYKNLIELEGIVLAGLIPIVFIIVLFVGSIFKRLNSLRNVAINYMNSKEVENGNIKYDKDTTKDEIGALANSLYSLHDRLIEHSNYIKNVPRFIKHETNRSLNDIYGSLQLLEKKCEEKKQKEKIINSIKGIEEISEIIQSMSNASCIKEILENSEKKTIDFKELIVESINSFPEILVSKDISYEEKYTYCCPIPVAQAFKNLLNNASEHCLEGSKIWVTSKVLENQLITTICNKGKTIPIEYQDKIFKVLYSTHNNDKTDSPNIGFGLHWVKEVVDHHKGTVEVNNLVDNDGVCFTVSIPIETVKPQSI